MMNSEATSDASHKIEPEHKGSPSPARPRLGILASHAIQYQAPIYQEISRRSIIDVDVAFLSARGATPHYEPDFGLIVNWDVDLTDGYQWTLLSDGASKRRARWLRALISWIREHDAVVIHGYADPAMLLATAVCHLLRVPYLLRGDSQPQTNATGIRRIARYVLASYAVRGAAGTLPIGQQNAAFYDRYGRTPQFLAPYSVDNDRFRRTADTARRDRRKLLIELGLNPEKPVAIFSGKLIPRKRPLDAVHAIQQCDGRINLLLIGDGQLRETIGSFEERLPVRCLGFVNQETLPRWYACGDVLVLPSAREPWGLVVNEAMACGLVPVVSDAVGCAPDLVEGIGEVFPTGDITKLAHALQRASDDVRERRDMIRERLEHFTVTETASGYERAALALRRRPRN